MDAGDPELLLERLVRVGRHNLAAFRRSPAAEISGALGDLGTLLPLMIALALQDAIDLPATLVFSGLFNLVTGVVFGVPLPVQPMKVSLSRFVLGFVLGFSCNMTNKFLPGHCSRIHRCACRPQDNGRRGRSRWPCCPAPERYRSHSAPHAPCAYPRRQGHPARRWPEPGHLGRLVPDPAARLGSPITGQQALGCRSFLIVIDYTDHQQCLTYSSPLEPKRRHSFQVIPPFLPLCPGRLPPRIILLLRPRLHRRRHGGSVTTSNTL